MNALSFKGLIEIRCVHFLWKTRDKQNKKTKRSGLTLVVGGLRVVALCCVVLAKKESGDFQIG